MSYARRIPGHYSRTVTDPSTLEAQLAQTATRGYAIDDEEYNYGVRCVAAPVYDHRGVLVGAIGISGPAGRVTLSASTNLVRLSETLPTPSARMGYDASMFLAQSGDDGASSH